jgi:protein-tyrosine phosphatase
MTTTPVPVTALTTTVPNWRGRLLRTARQVARLALERLETRRAHAVRRAPSPLIRRLRTASNVLVLCQGNVSRSVFAAELLKAALKHEPAIVVRSAGLGTEPGWRAHPRVVARCAALGIDVRAHGSVAATAPILRSADVVFVMEIAQLVDVTRRFPGARRKTFLLSTLAADVPVDIADPAGKADPEVDACLDLVAQAVTPLVAGLTVRDGAAAR